MSEFHQSNRIVSEKYLNEILGQVANLVRPEDFSDPKLTDPQKFYIDFKKGGNLEWSTGSFKVELALD